MMLSAALPEICCEMIASTSEGNGRRCSKTGGRCRATSPDMIGQARSGSGVGAGMREVPSSEFRVPSSEFPAGR
jgi:hypothetical protein